MGDFLKWAILAGIIFWIWRWWSSGVNANVSIGPGYGSPGYPVPNAGYTFMGPGMIFGINPQTFGQGGISQF